eukprot:g20840.t1
MCSKEVFDLSPSEAARGLPANGDKVRQLHAKGAGALGLFAADSAHLCSSGIIAAATSAKRSGGADRPPAAALQPVDEVEPLEPFNHPEEGKVSEAHSIKDPLGSFENNSPRPPPRPGDFEDLSNAPHNLPGADADHLHGRLGLKADGSLLVSPTPLPPGGLSDEERRDAHRGFCFNSRVSDSLPLDRLDVGAENVQVLGLATDREATERFPVGGLPEKGRRISKRSSNSHRRNGFSQRSVFRACEVRSVRSQHFPVASSGRDHPRG